MTVQIIGNGGFVNNGLPYNCMLLGQDFLVEAPPDIMPSLKNNDVSFHRLKRIYISHFHGDHYFGMPFLTLNLVNYYLETSRPIEPIEIIGPRGLRVHLRQLQQIATSEENPSVEALDKLFRFTEIDSSSKLVLGNSMEMIFHKMNHSKETYGFSLLEKSAFAMTYLIDTKWDESFVGILSKKPKYIFCDLNSNPDDKIRVHLSEKDLVDKAFPITGTATQYVGIHLSGIRNSDLPNLRYSRVGETYIL